MKPTICHLSTVHNLIDTRILYKECISLYKNGYPVFLVITADQDCVKEGIQIRALPKAQSRIHRFLFHGFLALKRGLGTHAHLFHFHDPELIPIGIILRLLGKKVVYDIHEDYAKNLLKSSWIRFKGVRRLVSWMYQVFEFIGTRIFNANAVVLDKWVPRYKNSVLVRNFPDRIDLQIPLSQRKDQVVYIGSLSPKRGAMQMLEGFIAALERKKNLQLIIIGMWENDHIKQKAMELIERYDAIQYIGTKPLSEVTSIMEESKLGLCFYTDNTYEENIPVKMYEYLNLGTPVLCTHFESWKRRVEGEGWGMTVDPFDKSAVADKILSALKPNQFSRLHEQCLTFRNSYSWQHEADQLLAAYSKILKIKD